MKENDRLYYEALVEVAEALGHTNTNPLSLSLLCIGHGISFEQKGKIYIEFNAILRENSFDDLNFAHKNKLEYVCALPNEWN